jgi:hypothetical protein
MLSPTAEDKTAAKKDNQMMRRPNSTQANPIGVGTSLKSLNFVNKKRNMEKMIQENLMLMKKIHFAEPSVQHAEL